MSNNSGDGGSKPTSPTHPKHQISRSITEISGGGGFPKLHRPHHHRSKDDKTPQSTQPNLQPTGVVDGTKSEGATPDESHNGSRRTSVVGSQAWETDLGGAPMPGNTREKRVVREGEVSEERERGILRAT
jgi:hypothetical protein